MALSWLAFCWLAPIEMNKVLLFCMFWRMTHEKHLALFARTFKACLSRYQRGLSALVYFSESECKFHLVKAQYNYGLYVPMFNHTRDTTWVRLNPATASISNLETSLVKLLEPEDSSNIHEILYALMDSWMFHFGVSQGMRRSALAHLEGRYSKVVFSPFPGVPTELRGASLSRRWEHPLKKVVQ